MNRKLFHNKAFVIEGKGEKKRAIYLALYNGGGAVCSYSKVDSLTSKGFKVCHNYSFERLHSK